MIEKTIQENQTLISFWDKAFALSEEDQKQMLADGGLDWKEIAPSEKLYQAACSLGKRNKVLDYGCGNAWAAVIAAKSGCADVTAADAAPGAVRAARLYAARYGVADRVHAVCSDSNWLQSVPDGTFDGLICSNVLDVVPPETAEEILRELARVLSRDGTVIVGLNYYLSPEGAAARNMVLEDGNRLYINGVLRLVSRTDEEWAQIFSRWFTFEKLEHFAWPGEAKETRRLFWLRKREDDYCSPN
ncbi:MAG: class I SAM-dependent methyltransferase [Clostridia bacterium]|nr:class I SAM-dependent methyltransferase [Clostridia bacterium]